MRKYSVEIYQGIPTVFDGYIQFVSHEVVADDQLEALYRVFCLETGLAKQTLGDHIIWAIKAITTVNFNLYDLHMFTTIGGRWRSTVTNIS